VFARQPTEAIGGRPRVEPASANQRLNEHARPTLKENNMDRRTFSANALKVLGAAALAPLVASRSALAAANAEQNEKALTLKTQEEAGKAGNKSAESAAKSSATGKAQENASKSGGSDKVMEARGKSNDKSKEESSKAPGIDQKLKGMPGARFQPDEAERKRLAALSHLAGRLIG
jgi:hypothetical protein